MNVFEHPDFDGHEEIAFFTDEAAGLRAIIAIHDRVLGPALGGVRMYPYADSDAALTDVLRLSRGMSYKSALAGLKLGGGKAVIIGDSRKHKSTRLFEAMGRSIDKLGGRYIAAEDSGTSADDVRIMSRTTTHVAGIAPKSDVDGVSTQGDPSPWTAYGVYVGIRAAVRHQLGQDSVAGLRVAIQGVGNVGRSLARLLHRDGAELVLADIYPDAVSRLADETGARVVGAGDIISTPADVFAPCALGAVINDDTVEQVRANIVAGSANNQLLAPRHGRRLMERGRLYAPDYVINAGGVIDVEHERRGYDPAAVKAHVERIGNTLSDIFERATATGVPTSEIADAMARKHLDEARASMLAAA